MPALFEGKILLSGEAQPVLIDNLCAGRAGNLQSSVGRPAVDDYDFICTGAGSQHFGEVSFFIFGD